MTWLFAVVIVAVVIADLCTKFNIDGILNFGIAWGLGAQLPCLWIVVVVASLLVCVVVTWWFIKLKQRSILLTLGTSMFLGGVLGNAIDRMVSNGAVHDFIDFVIFKNNLADIAISVGAVLVMVSMVLKEVPFARR